MGNCGVTMKRRRSSVGPHQGGAKRVRTFVDPVDGVRSPFRPVNGLSGEEEQNSKKRVRGSPAGNPRGVKRHCGGANRVAPAAPNLDPAEIALRKAQAASEATANYAKIQNWFSQNQAPQVQRVSTPQRQAEWQSMRSQVQKMRPVQSSKVAEEVVSEQHNSGAAAEECSEAAAEEQTEEEQTEAAAVVEEDARKRRRSSVRLLREQAVQVQDANKQETQRKAKLEARELEKQQRIEARQQEHRASVAKETQLEAQKTNMRPQISAKVAKWFKTAPSFIWLLQKQFNVRLKTSPSPADVHKAYVRCLAKYHPDKYRNQAVEQQIEAEEIYKSLGNAYDAYKKKHRIN